MNNLDFFLLLSSIICSLLDSCVSVNPCTDYAILDDETRSVEYILPFGEAAECDRYITQGWYRFSGNRNMPTTAPSIGACGTNAPIWIDGELPQVEGEQLSLPACKVGFLSTCESTWNIPVQNCSVFNVFYLTTFASCEGRYCMESGEPCQEGTTSETGFAPCKEEELHINLTGYVYPEAFIPTYDPYSVDRMLMFRCHHYLYMQNDNNATVDTLIYDVRWDIDDKQFIVKENLHITEILTLGILRRTEWQNAKKKIGITVNCAIRGKHMENGTSSEYVVSGWKIFAGIQVWPTSLTIQSGQSALVNVYPTVPIACIYNSSVPCKLRIELFDFKEQFTSGSAIFCNDSFADFSKPSLCGLEINAWSPYDHALNISIPSHSVPNEEYNAVVLLRSSGLSYDPLWADYHLAPITIRVTAADSYWYFPWCSSGSDPWFWTFDWQSYGFNDEGEFVLFRHKTKPIEVHTIMKKSRWDDGWTENCAIAVRAASDVFIIYGCGTPTNWIIRRLNCDVDREYLKVYNRWDSYEIHLPTGSVVNVWKFEERLNIEIYLQGNDGGDVEGLCGNSNGNYQDDFTDRNGDILQNATEFARSWSVPQNESLFVAKQRDEILDMYMSYMYCACSSTTSGTLSPDVDCSWQENVPLCPPINWENEPCQIRKKRNADEEDVIIDASVDIVSHKEHPEVNEEWKNGWNETSAESACLSYFLSSPVYAACSELDNVNVTNVLATCVINIRISGTTNFIPDSLEYLISQCSVTIRHNTTVSTTADENGTTIFDSIVNNMCPSDCRYNGVKTGDCVKGYCVCFPDYTGEDCRINMKSPPSLSGLSVNLICDTSKRVCNSISVFGSGYYASEQLRCRLQTAKLLGTEIVPDGKFIMKSATYNNNGEIKCSLVNAKRRQKLSTTPSSVTTLYLLSVTNNGIDFSQETPVVIYDSMCTDCTIVGSLIICKQRNDVCIIGNSCHVSSNVICQSTSTNSSSKLWIVGLVMGALALIILAVIIVRMSVKHRMSIFPSCTDQKKIEYEQDNQVFYNSHSTSDLRFMNNFAPASTFSNDKKN